MQPKARMCAPDCAQHRLDLFYGYCSIGAERYTAGACRNRSTALRERRGLFARPVLKPPTDGVAHNTFRMEPAAHGIGLHAQTNQIIALEAVQRLFTTDSHSSILLAGQHKPDHQAHENGQQRKSGLQPPAHHRNLVFKRLHPRGLRLRCIAHLFHIFGDSGDLAALLL